MISTIKTPSISLPLLDTSIIANSLTQILPNPSLCQLLILEGQYILRYQEGEAIITKLISPEAVRQAFTHLAVDSGFLPPGVVRWGSSSEGDWLLKFIPPNYYQISCIVGEKALRLDIPLPGFIFIGKGSRYYIWAVKERRFNSLPNVSNDGTICFGSNRVPRASSDTLESTWQLFLKSPFNGDSVSQKSKSCSEDVRSHLIALHNTRKKKYPKSDLIPYHSYRVGLEYSTNKNCTVEQIVNQIIQ